jgi:tetratricopeptide (TPR) repeat protein
LLKETEESEPTKEQLEKVDKDGENIELGIKAYNDQNYEEAIGYLSKVPDRWISHMVLGQIYSILEQYDKALFHSSKAIEIDPRPYNPYFHKGMVYYGLKDYKNAISCLEEARARGIKKTQDEALTDLFLGHSYGYLMNLEKSKENYKLALPLFYKLNDSKNISKIEKQLKDMEEYMESKN